MLHIKHTLVFIVAASFVLPLAAQKPTATSKPRVDTVSQTYRDAQGNVIGFSFLEWRMDGSVDARKDNLKAQRVTLFSNYIGFTSKEAERFWPVYNEWQEKLEALQKERRKVLEQLANFERMNNEKEVKALLDAYVNSRVQESALFQEYYKKFSAILPPIKVVRLYIAEEEFKQRLLQILRSRGF
ncbi:MAG: hypothetical protein FWH23_00410 [Bacteroidales bacterium]|nr:hypothetical protein [Bacteroidales bacterium]MCL2132775.1 hypothetical protein [Bacteroidales bacterium]